MLCCTLPSGSTGCHCEPSPKLSITSSKSWSAGLITSPCGARLSSANSRRSMCSLRERDPGSESRPVTDRSCDASCIAPSHCASSSPRSKGCAWGSAAMPSRLAFRRCSRSARLRASGMPRNPASSSARTRCTCSAWDTPNVQSFWYSRAKTVVAENPSSTMRSNRTNRALRPKCVSGSPAESSISRFQRFSAAVTRIARSRSGVISAAFPADSAMCWRRRSAMIPASSWRSVASTSSIRCRLSLTRGSAPEREVTHWSATAAGTNACPITHMRGPWAGPSISTSLRCKPHCSSIMRKADWGCSGVMAFHAA